MPAPEEMALARIAFHRARIEEALATRARSYAEGSSEVEKAIAYVLEGQGKRVRPLLTLLAAECLGGEQRAEASGPLDVALAIEMIHCYSLVHDDLPCMDDDDLRRGRPTTHKVFGEAQALLAGDGLLTDAFLLIGEADLPPLAKARIVTEVARAAGTAGMVKGQSLDLWWTARPGGTIETLRSIHEGKTAALLGAACAIGAHAGGGETADAERMRHFGERLGLAFQVVDDLLDESAGTGKTAGKDREAGKLTYVSLLGREEARAEATRLTDSAVEAVASYGERANGLIAMTRLLLDRTN